MNVLLRKINKNSCIWNNCIINNLRCASSRPRNKIKYFTKNDAPPHRVGVIKSWDSKHTGKCLMMLYQITKECVLVMAELFC